MKLHDLINITENKYNQLLTALLLTYAASAFVMDWDISGFLLFLVLLVSLVLAIYRLKPGRKPFRWYVAFAVTALILQSLQQANAASAPSRSDVEIINSLIFIVLLGITAHLISKEIFPTRKVTGDTIKGGICVYMLLGFIWAKIYAIAFTVDTNAFVSVSPTTPLADLSYFSFTTLTTVGYGDITPNSPIARVLANLQAIVGTMYPAIFIARLVSLYENESGK